jgi:hypothetical protein
MELTSGTKANGPGEESFLILPESDVEGEEFLDDQPEIDIACDPFQSVQSGKPDKS